MNTTQTPIIPMVETSEFACDDTPTPLTPLAERYKLASEKVLLNWPKWKIIALKEDFAKNIDSRFTEEYVKAVAELAENEDLPLSM